jgi:hypothetical protein
MLVGRYGANRGASSLEVRDGGETGPALLHDLHLRAVLGCEQRLDPHPTEAELRRLRLVSLVQLPEGPRPEPGELRGVLVAHGLARVSHLAEAMFDVDPAVLLG